VRDENDPPRASKRGEPTTADSADLRLVWRATVVEVLRIVDGLLSLEFSPYSPARSGLSVVSGSGVWSPDEWWSVRSATVTAGAIPP
jgi:hypothetical protein